MKVLLLFAVCLMVTVSWGQPPPPPSPPRISETFSTRFRVEAKSNTVHTYISGDVKRDYMSRKQWTHQITSREGEQRKHDWTLDRCDMNYTFSYHWEGENPQPQGSCESKSYCNFSPIFAWTSNTTYSETIDYEHQRIDVFVAKVDNVEVSIGVAHGQSNIPYFTTQKLEDFFVIYYYQDFDTTAPDESSFNIPSDCRHKQL